MSTRGSETISAYIEEYLENLASLPNEIRRNFELMRALDKEAADAAKELRDSEKKVLTDMKRKSSRTSKEMNMETALADVKSKRLRVQQMVDEKVQIANQTRDRCDIHLDRLDTELSKFEEILRTSGEFSATGAAPGEEVAAKVDDEWILSRVKEYNINTGFYTVADVDDATKNFELPDTEVVILDTERISKGEEVFAVYPDTTSFYPAVVTSVPRRNASLQSAPLACTVQFNDDADESGVTPDRFVQLRYVIRPPEDIDEI
jgi:hypothetical protein